MSDSGNVRKRVRTAEFAWPGGDRPGELHFGHEVAPDLAAALMQRVAELMALPVNGDRLVAGLNPPNGPLGRFRVSVGGREFFVRTSARWKHPQVEHEMMLWAEAHGAVINHPEVTGAEFPWEGEVHRLDIRTLLHARHYNESCEDLRATARCLRRCHEALRTFPGTRRVAALSAERFGRLEEVLAAMRELIAREQWDQFAGDPEWGKRRADWLRTMVAEADLRFDLEPGAQCLHAQMHRGNVLYRLEDGAPVLLDFEDAIFTLATPVWDTAHLVQRFAMHDAPKPALLQQRLAAIREGYGAPLGDVVQMMRRAAWLSVAILVGDHLWEGSSTPIHEYEKFVSLETQAREYAALLHEEC